MSIVLDKVGHRQSRILIWKDEEPLEFFLKQVKLSSQDEELLKRYTVERRKKDLLISRFLLQKIDANATLAYYPNGKPYVVNNNYQISISHSRDLVSIIVHPTQRVGIDIEYISPRVEKLKQRFLSKDELKSANTLSRLTLYWSAKECLFKIDQHQGLDFKEDLSIKIENKTLLTGIVHSSMQYNIQYSIQNNWVLCYTINEDSI